MFFTSKFCSPSAGDGSLSSLDSEAVGVALGLGAGSDFFVELATAS